VRGGRENRAPVLRQAEDQRAVQLRATDPVPGRAAVGRGQHADAGVAVLAGVGLAGAGVDGVTAARSGHEQRPDRQRGLRVADRGPMLAAVGGLPHAAIGGTREQRPVRRRGQSRHAAGDPAIAGTGVAEAARRVDVLRRIGEVIAVGARPSRALGPGTAQGGQRCRLRGPRRVGIRIRCAVRREPLRHEPVGRLSDGLALLARASLSGGPLSAANPGAAANNRAASTDTNRASRRMWTHLLGYALDVRDKRNMLPAPPLTVRSPPARPNFTHTLQKTAVRIIVATAPARKRHHCH
jgi:hypothetical protein